MIIYGDQQIEQHLIEADDGPDVSFTGQLLFQAVGDIYKARLPDKSVEVTLSVYKTDSGFVCSKKYEWSLLNTETSVTIVESISTELFKFFGYGRLAKSLYKELGLDYVLTI